MADHKSYIKILQESLEKKIDVLDQIILRNEEQAQAIEERNMELFEFIMDQKAVLIEDLNQLDSGFETVYDRVKEDLNQNAGTYREEIRCLQGLVSRMTDKSMAVQAEENRNKRLAEQYFKSVRTEIHRGRKSVQAASSYYKSMSGTNFMPSNLLDEKN